MKMLHQCKKEQKLFLSKIFIIIAWFSKKFQFILIVFSLLLLLFAALSTFPLYQFQTSNFRNTKVTHLTLFRMGLFGAAHGWRIKKMKLGTVIRYLKKIEKLYELHDTPLEFC